MPINRYGLSPTSAMEIGERLSWSEAERTLFTDMVTAEHARDHKMRAEAKTRIQQRTNIGQQLSLDSFTVIADWHHYAIMELLDLPEGSEGDAAWLARRLGLNVNAVNAALKRLLRLDLIKKTASGYHTSSPFTASPSGTPSDAIKNFHRQILEKAISAIQLQMLDERDFSTMILTFDRSNIQDASEDIRKFRRNFNNKYGKAESGNEVYCLAVQFFSLENQRTIKGSIE